MNPAAFRARYAGAASFVCTWRFRSDVTPTLFDLSALLQAIMVLSPTLRIARESEQPMWIWLLFWPLVIGSWLLFAERLWDEAIHYQLVAAPGMPFQLLFVDGGNHVP